MEWIYPQIKKIEVLNLENFDQDDKEFIKIEVIDFKQTQGAFIDREMN